MLRMSFCHRTGVWAAQSEAGLWGSVILFGTVLSVICTMCLKSTGILFSHLQNGHNKSGPSVVGDFTQSSHCWSLQPHCKSRKEKKNLFQLGMMITNPFQTLCQQFTFPEPCTATPNSGRMQPAVKGEWNYEGQKCTVLTNSFLSLELGTRHWHNFSHLVWTASQRQSQSLFCIVSCWHQPVSVWFCTIETVNFSPIEPLTIFKII